MKLSPPSDVSNKTAILAPTGLKYFDGGIAHWHSAMTMIYSLIRPLIFRLDAEKAHNFALAALRLLPAGTPVTPDAVLTIRVAGIAFPNPVGLAAGFDKNGLVVEKMHHFGYGFAELGTITPNAQEGNPSPRLFRLPEDRAIINRLGFNNRGQAAAVRRIIDAPRDGRVIGINVGANKDSTDRIADYELGVRTMAPLADYLTINISSPNTPGLRALQGREMLDSLLRAVMEARGQSCTPIFLKVAPDLDTTDIDDIARCVGDHRIDALIITNTTVSRPPLRSPLGAESGGLSGEPLRDLALQRLRDFRGTLGETVPLIGVGGIANADDAYARIRAGASLVQLYSAMIYEGPWIAQHINRGLKMRLKRDGFTNIRQAVGIDAPSA